MLAKSEKIKVEKFHSLPGRFLCFLSPSPPFGLPCRFFKELAPPLFIYFFWWKFHASSPFRKEGRNYERG